MGIYGRASAIRGLKRAGDWIGAGVGVVLQLEKRGPIEMRLQGPEGFIYSLWGINKRVSMKRT